MFTRLGVPKYALPGFGEPEYAIPFGAGAAPSTRSPIIYYLN